MSWRNSVTKRRVKPWLTLCSFACIFVGLTVPTYAYGASEYVTVIKIVGNDDQGIIERSNGERWLIEKGIGALSFWLYEGKQVIIHSPGLFAGVGSTVILPDREQSARIWSAERIEGGNPSSNLPTPSASDLAAIALECLGYYKPDAKDKDKVGIVESLIAFQKEKGLAPTGKASSEVQLALSNAVIAIEPKTDTNLELALALLNSAKKLMTTPFALNAGTETYIVSVSSNGAIVKLGDGSIYEVDIVGQIKTMLWLPAQRVLRQSNSLLHLNKGQKVRATLIAN